ncbi:MAG: hypothetical protein PVJ38_02955 [Candidatus Bathyarchaeota archaeon]|jgi:hypothetical protein
MDELIGLGRVNDFSTFVLRAKLAKRFGMFGEIPMWGGIKLHQFYPPLSTILVRFLTMGGALLLYLTSTAIVWSLGRGIPFAALYLLSFFHVFHMLENGRFSEFLGYTLAVSAWFMDSGIYSGILYGLAALSHPLGFLVGGALLALKMDLMPFLVAFPLCGLWYTNFLFQREELSYLEEKRPDKILGIYVCSYLSMVNLLFFLFTPMWLGILGTLIVWLLPVSLKGNYRQPRISLTQIEARIRYFLGALKTPVYLSHLSNILPKIDDIGETPVLINKDDYASSFNELVWASASYLLDRDIIVFNGLPATEVPLDNLNLTQAIDLKEYSVDELK